MLVTKREQQIIDEIVKKGQVSIADLLDVVGVSRRTLYRDLQNLQDFLPKYQVNLIKIDQYYTLKGELSNLTDKRVVEEYSQNERHFMELILLIFEQAKLANFMNRFAISQPTATGDLKIIEQNLTFAGNGLVREGGLEVIASEYSKRTHSSYPVLLATYQHVIFLISVQPSIKRIKWYSSFNRLILTV